MSLFLSPVDFVLDARVAVSPLDDPSACLVFSCLSHPLVAKLNCPTISCHGIWFLSGRQWKEGGIAIPLVCRACLHASLCVRQHVPISALSCLLPCICAFPAHAFTLGHVSLFSIVSDELSGPARENNHASIHVARPSQLEHNDQGWDGVSAFSLSYSIKPPCQQQPAFQMPVPRRT